MIKQLALAFAFIASAHAGMPAAVPEGESNLQCGDIPDMFSPCCGLSTEEKATTNFFIPMRDRCDAALIAVVLTPDPTKNLSLPDENGVLTDMGPASTALLSSIIGAGEVHGSWYNDPSLAPSVLAGTNNMCSFSDSGANNPECVSSDSSLAFTDIQMNAALKPFLWSIATEKVPFLAPYLLKMKMIAIVDFDIMGQDLIDNLNNAASAYPGVVDFNIYHSRVAFCSHKTTRNWKPNVLGQLGLPQQTNAEITACLDIMSAGGTYYTPKYGGCTDVWDSTTLTSTVTESAFEGIDFNGPLTTVWDIVYCNATTTQVVLMDGHGDGPKEFSGLNGCPIADYDFRYRDVRLNITRGASHGFEYFKTYGGVLEKTTADANFDACYTQYICAVNFDDVDYLNKTECDATITEKFGFSPPFTLGVFGHDPAKRIVTFPGHGSYGVPPSSGGPFGSVYEKIA